MLLNFADSLLSRQQMKSVKGGGGYCCKCGNLVSNQIGNNPSLCATACAQKYDDKGTIVNC